MSVLAVYAGNDPGPLLSSLSGTSVSAVIVFVAFVACGLWVLRTSSASAWQWAAGLGVVLATAQFAGMLLRKFDGAVDRLLAPDNLLWVAVHWIGTAWMVSCGLAALIGALDTQDLRTVSDSPHERGGRLGLFGRLVASLRSSDDGRRRKCLLIVLGVLVLSRLPYLLVHWPGIVAFDTYRSFAYARGATYWESYEPVGHSLLIAVIQWSGTALGWGDIGGVAIGAITMLLASSAAFTFMLGRMAVWGLHPGIWAGTFAWVVLLPVFGYHSVQLVKDVPFSIAMVVFLTCVGELSFEGSKAAGKRWLWVTMTVAATFAFLMRNNGIHVMALSLPLLLIPLRHFWKRILVVLAALVVAYGIYVGPTNAILDVRPGPKAEPYSVPIQQLGLIARLHSADLSPADREFITRAFSGKPPEKLGKHYVPWLSDPMKLATRKAWADLTTREFLAGWARIAAKYPSTAMRATLANTVGYWDPEAPSYDGINRWTANSRRIDLDIPSGEPTTGIAAKIESSGIMPTHTYGRGLHDDGYRSIPVLGLAMSPGPVCWFWLIAALLVLRRRDRTALAVFVPAGVLLLSFLAGPVSGGQRYSLALFMGLPLALAAVALARRHGGESRGHTRADEGVVQPELGGIGLMMDLQRPREQPHPRQDSDSVGNEPAFADLTGHRVTSLLGHRSGGPTLPDGSTPNLHGGLPQLRSVGHASVSPHTPADSINEGTCQFSDG